MGKGLVREGIAETRITILLLSILYSLLFYCAFGVVLSVDKNRNWRAASDWLVGLRYVKCEQGFNWTSDVACIGMLLT
jgi:hypothetical protein